MWVGGPGGKSLKTLNNMLGLGLGDLLSLSLSGFGGKPESALSVCERCFYFPYIFLLATVLLFSNGPNFKETKMTRLLSITSHTCGPV